MDYQIFAVKRSSLDEQCLEITLSLRPTRWQRWFRRIPQGKITCRGYGKRWYQAPEYGPVPRALADILFEISYDRRYRHLQQAAHKSPTTYSNDPL